MKVAELALCSQAQEGRDAAHCVNLLMVDREVHEALDAKQQGRKDTFKRDGNYKRPQDGQRPNPKNKHYNSKYPETTTPWIQKDSEEKLKLKQQAATIKQKLGKDRSDEQKIALILNIISPDNCAKKLGELR
jgi:hypothetical protein